MSLGFSKIGDLFPEIKIGGTPSRGNSSFFGGSHIWVSIRDMDGKKVITTSNEKLTDSGVFSSNCKLVKKGSLLFSFKLTVGRVAFAGEDLYTNEAIAAFDPEDAERAGISLEYLSLVLPAIARKDSTKNSMGAALLNKDRIASLSIPHPDIDDQLIIAAKLKSQLAELENAQLAAQIQLKEINKVINNVIEFQIAKALSSSSNQVKLGDVSSITAKIVQPNQGDYENLPHVSAENIESVTGRLMNICSAKEDGMTSGKYLFDAGDILYSKLRPYLRKVAKPDFDGLCSADMYPIKVDESVLNMAFLKLLLTSNLFTEYANEKSSRSRMPKLNREQLFDFEFCLPTIDAQMQCVDRIDSVLGLSEQASTAVKVVLKDIDQLSQKILAQAFNQ